MATAPAHQPSEQMVSVVIVSYHTGEALWHGLTSVLEDRSVAELILVDNGNPVAVTDRLTAWSVFEPRLKLLTGHGNVGFSAGCNLGASASTGSLILLLNPDCRLEPDTLDRILASLPDKTGLWAATPRLLNPDGTEQNGCRRNQGTPVQCLVEALQLYRLNQSGLMAQRLNLATTPLPDRPVVVEAISGAFMLMPRLTFFGLGGLDDGYFLHVEDLDFCQRLRLAGGRCWFVPTIVAWHLKGTSGGSGWAVERHKIAGFGRYFRNHFRPRYRLPILDSIWLILALGITLRHIVRSALRSR